VLRPGCEKRLLAALEKAMLLGADTLLAAIEGAPERLYSRRFACVRCDVSVPEVSPRAFSFNSPYGACPGCEGLGVRWDLDPAKVIPDSGLSLLEGAVHPWRRHGSRLRRESLAVRLLGKSLADYVRLPVSEARATFDALEFGDRERPVADRLLHQIRDRLRFLERVGVGYLSLDRATTSLSAGEAHRI